ncbi:MAG: hypothetical protein QNJ98_07365 [Planctomycetota bacterium]|nr:hypothetical protein [Planctomycetota bacterium]
MAADPDPAPDVQRTPLRERERTKPVHRPELERWAFILLFCAILLTVCALGALATTSWPWDRVGAYILCAVAFGTAIAAWRLFNAAMPGGESRRDARERYERTFE